ncbi:hypothetical protein Q5752_002823 [Cryptotrichosporon argae]
MALPPRGLPILSGPPPVVESPACRQCGQSFNPLWRRAHACGHCGYEYCSSCLSDGQALMPRRAAAGGGGSGSSGGGGGGVGAALAEGIAEIKDVFGLKKDSATSSGSSGAGSETSGYDVESVCLPCLSMLQVTAAPVQTLRALPIKRLKDYLAAYDIPCVGPREKDDFVQAVLKARNPQTGCLPPANESYYRRKSVPKLGQASTLTPSARPPPARPAPPPSRPPQQQYRPPYPPRAQPPSASARPAAAPRPAPPRPAAQPARPPPRPAASPAPPPPPPVPTILSLVALPKSYLSSLSIGTLKAILYENHVRVDYGQVLEKQELINRVSELIDDERKRLERQRLEEERLAAPPVVRNGHVPSPNGAVDDAATDPSAPPAAPATPAPADAAAAAPAAAATHVPTGPAPEMERGLCVVCQDEEATLAVVDCGHLAMCAHCSDLVMATTRECPLCRTRIVTPQRLIRIYRV